MKLSSTDARNLVKFGIGGLTAGLLYQLSHVWIGQRINLENLHPTPEAIHKDPELFELFCKLQKHRQFAEKEFRRAVDDADRLLYLRYAIAEGQTKPMLEDRTTAFVYYKIACDRLWEMVEKCSQDDSGATAEVTVAVHILYTKIHDALTSHFKAVFTSTRNLCEG